MNKHPITKHHILCESWGWYLRPNNVLLLRENVHRAVHTLFSDNTPIQRLRTSLEADKTVMIPEVYKVISDTLRRFERREIEIYEPDCFNADKFLTRSKRWNE